MKTLFASLLTILCTSTAIAQVQNDSTSTEKNNQRINATLHIEDGKVEAVVQTTDSTGTPSDTTRLDFKKSYVTIIRTPKELETDTTAERIEKEDKEQKYSHTFWNGIDLGINGYLTPSGNIGLPDNVGYMDIDYGKSRFLGINFLQVKARVVKDYVGFTSGLTFQFHNYKFRNDQTLQFTNDTLTAFRDSSINLTKNKLRAIYLGIPLMLELNTSLDEDKNFHISAGIVGKILIGEMYKIKYTKDGDKRKDKIKNNLFFNTLQADAMLRIGYRNFTLFGTVGLLPLFDNDHAPDLHSFAAGIFIKV